MNKIFIDGRVGTTGLRIYERLVARDDLEILSLSEEKRKDTAARAELLNSCDIAILCLPDEAAKEAVALITNPDVTVIDASTAHRTHSGWAYGFPQLSDGARENIKNSRRIAVPGCHATGYIALTRPLLDSGVLPASAKLSCHSVTGYSGGGKAMIAEYEDENRPHFLDAPRQYALSQEHKHLKEMVAVSGVLKAPLFCPIVAPYYSGMTVTVPIRASDVGGATPDDLKQIYKKTYKNAGKIVVYKDFECGFMSAGALSGKDSMRISVCGNNERILLTATYDNLGKGASGAAVECLNIKVGADTEQGLLL